MKAETLNQTGMDRWEMKNEVGQFIECIPAGSLSVGRLGIAEDLKKQIINSKNDYPVIRIYFGSIV
ncbi:MAG: hypothetical protein IPJ86_06040 [Bacteroidetes bacterium]|nr:hypothetical protein [Bacteroidota bacterium]